MTIDAKVKFVNRDAFLKALNNSLKRAGLSLNPVQYKVVLQCLSERDESADICVGLKGRPEADPLLRDTENIELTDDLDSYYEREVKPYVPEAWIDRSKTKVGYDIPFTRNFYKLVPPRSLTDIDSDLAAVTAEIVAALNRVVI